MVSSMSLSVLMARVVNTAGGSVVVAILMHRAFNRSGALDAAGCALYDDLLYRGRGIGRLDRGAESWRRANARSAFRVSSVTFPSGQGRRRDADDRREPVVGRAVSARADVVLHIVERELDVCVLVTRLVPSSVAA
jgi:hypothetical protein